ncbi:MAG: hypothetical protein J7M34_08315 [Anaerolineae bacterium]|nr:hypothetical protein [Anaerolineae bacterium]
MFPRIIGRTYMDESVAIGTMNRGDLWNQRRPLVAYWGSAEHPIALQVRCLHDGYDYSSALIFTRQAGPYVLAAVVFATDYGDRHIGLDPVQDQSIMAQDLRLRFQIINPPTDRPIFEELALGYEVNTSTIGNATLSLQIPHVIFGGRDIITITDREQTDEYLDIVLYYGRRRRIDFGRMRQAAVIFGLQITPAAEPMKRPWVDVTQAGSYLSAFWRTPRGDLKIDIPLQPGPFAELERLTKGVDDA